MKIEYAVLSSDNNPKYLNYWPYVATMWKRIGIKPVLFYIDNNPIENYLAKYGTIYQFKPIEWEISQQAQCIRLWACKVLDSPFIISDIDMLPISKKYYEEGANKIGDVGIVSYSSDIIQYRWYITNPQYPMCYIAGDPNTFIDFLEIKENNAQDFLERLKALKIRYGTDQKFFFIQSRKSYHTVKHLERGWIDGMYAKNRLENINWPETDLKIDEYIDCHLSKFSEVNKNRIKLIFDTLNINIQ